MAASMPSRSRASGSAWSIAGWHDRLLDRRDRLLADVRFQRWATRFWPTRWIARRRSRALFDLCAGFVYSQVLLAAVRLRLLERLAASPRGLAELPALLDLPEPATRRLVAATHALGLTQPRAAGRIGLGPHGAAMLANPGIAAMIEHHAMLYADLADPVALLRGGRSATALGAYWPYAGSDDPATLPVERTRAYTRLMAASQPLVAAEVLDAYPLGGHRRLLDLGGGDGSFVRAVADRHPSLALELFDLPSVAAQARSALAAAGLAERVAVHGGDLWRSPLPEGADLVTLVRVVHDHDDDRVRALLARVHAILPPGGSLLIAEPMAGAPGAEPIGDAYFGFYLLAMGTGRARPPETLIAMLRDAGFATARIVPTRNPLLTGLIHARRAEESVAYA